MASRKHSDETIAAARTLYAEGIGVPKIAVRTGIPESTLRHHLKGARTALARPAPADGRLRVRPAKARPLLIARLWSTAERQVAEIERRLADAGGDAASLERDARTLSVLARTIRDLLAIEDNRKAKAAQTHGETEIPRDLDAFRRALAEKLVALGRLEHGD